ncbi:MAG: fibronectin type III-like domain-contianing protein, partial [Promicromonosporaceae bacterium]|nr:fibronectin type III-like domain-contianing protein [Promicromonosporaceae bacterium]
SGEGRDRSSGPGDYLLTPTELANLAQLGTTYSRVIVVLNTGGIMDTTFYKTINAQVTDPAGGQALDALFLMSQPGQEAGNALVEVLDGTVSPSGKLVDTWASAYSYYPASATFANNDGNTAREEYTEGIYVGYRYFDSFYRTLDAADPTAVVNYPFGYGLSYTSFKVDAQGVRANKDTVTVRARVTNTGPTASGKDVVQVYVSAPQSGLDKPYQELQGYAKTDTLAPGESQIVKVQFPTTELSSYDPDRQAYVMDAGSYVVRLGDSSRGTHVAATLSLASQVVTEQLTNELTDQAPATELASDPANFYSYAGEVAEIAQAQHLTLQMTGFHTADDRSPYEQTVPIDSTSPYYNADYGMISTTTAYLDPDQTDWAGTGAPYQPKTGESVQYVQTDPSTTLYDVYAGRVPMKTFVAGLTLAQLAAINEGGQRGGSTLKAVGAAGYTTSTLESLGIPGMTLSDGPAGLRITQVIQGDPVLYQYATAWPIGTLLAQTWNTGLVEQVGTAIGGEELEFGATLWLAPGMNLHRDPLNGRNFEYFSEDPLVAGMSAASETKGVQSNPGVGVTLKHFAANNQESARTSSNSVIGERALRELYLKGFEIAVKSAQPMAVMSSYNRLNGPYTAESYDLLTDILRGEWGFKGLVMTDWGGVRAGAVDVQYAGNDLITPGNNTGEIVNAPAMRLGDLQRNAARILNVVMQSAPFGELAQLQGVHGVQIRSYTGQFHNLPTYVVGSSDPVQPPTAGGKG